MRIVQDTNVFVAALRSGAGASRLVLESCLRRAHQPLMAQALWLEYRDVLSRADLWKDCALTSEERGQLLDDFERGRLHWSRVWQFVVLGHWLEDSFFGQQSLPHSRERVTTSK